MPLTINPVDALLWTFRRNERDVMRMYAALSSVMRLATGGSMLNFGYWTDDACDPVSAQRHLCSVFAELAELDSARVIADAGSGFGTPAALWRDRHDVSVVCVNTGLQQMADSEPRVWPVCSSSTRMPLRENTVDRVLALESAQHFRPFEQFVSESKRVLDSSGLLVLAIPVVTGSPSDLGILRLAWSSEHYGARQVRDMITGGGFEIIREEMIGASVYSPLADYYVRERARLKALILKSYPSYVESVLFRSISKMKKASEAHVIDYALIKCRLL